ncbi:MAG: roadblock/LC7 domain-containing protein [Siculibacillus sp.]
MTDYYQRLSRAVAERQKASFPAREAIYRSARSALINALRNTRPPVPQSVITTESWEFDEAVARVEADVRRNQGREELAPLVAVFGDLPEKASNDDRPQPAPARPEPTPEVTEVTESPPLEEERPMSRLDELNKILRKLQSDSPGVEASALISEDGLMIASALTPDLEENRVAGMTATLLNLGTRAAVELARGEVKEVIIRGEHGYAVMINAGRGALLLALANESAKLGLIFFDMHEAIRGLKKVL